MPSAAEEAAQWACLQAWPLPTSSAPRLGELPPLCSAFSLPPSLSSSFCPSELQIPPLLPTPFGRGPWSNQELVLVASSPGLFLAKLWFP